MANQATAKTSTGESWRMPRWASRQLAYQSPLADEVASTLLLRLACGL